MDAAPSEEIVDQVRALAAEVNEVKFIEKCYVRKMGFDYFVDLHIQVDQNLSVAEGHRIAHLVKDKLLDSGLSIKDVLIHIEPFTYPG
jgi:divalent metal cation (Fe/Co/Zn/Cd) transporter